MAVRKRVFKLQSHGTQGSIMMVPCRLLAMMMGFSKSLSKTIITLVTEI